MWTHTCIDTRTSAAAAAAAAAAAVAAAAAAAAAAQVHADQAGAVPTSQALARHKKRSGGLKT